MAKNTPEHPKNGVSLWRAAASRIRPEHTQKVRAALQTASQHPATQAVLSGTPIERVVVTQQSIREDYQAADPAMLDVYSQELRDQAIPTVGDVVPTAKQIHRLVLMEPTDAALEIKGAFRRGRKEQQRNSLLAQIHETEKKVVDMVAQRDLLTAVTAHEQEVAQAGMVHAPSVQRQVVRQAAQGIYRGSAVLGQALSHEFPIIGTATKYGGATLAVLLHGEHGHPKVVSQDGTRLEKLKVKGSYVPEAQKLARLVGELAKILKNPPAEFDQAAITQLITQPDMADHLAIALTLTDPQFEQRYRRFAFYQTHRPTLPTDTRQLPPPLQ